MNETLKTIQNRRSCREFNDVPLKEEDLLSILKAGTMAPSAMNRQSANILCLRNPEIVEDLRARILEFMGKDSFYGAKVIVIVYSTKDAPCNLQDGSCVLENMFLAATSLGVGSCWINCLHDYFATDEGNAFKKKVLGLEDNDLTVGACILGYPLKEDIPMKEKKSDYIRII